MSNDAYQCWFDLQEVCDALGVSMDHMTRPEWELHENAHLGDWPSYHPGYMRQMLDTIGAARREARSEQDLRSKTESLRHHVASTFGDVKFHHRMEDTGSSYFPSFRRTLQTSKNPGVIRYMDILDEDHKKIDPAEQEIMRLFADFASCRADFRARAEKLEEISRKVIKVMEEIIDHFRREEDLIVVIQMARGPHRVPGTMYQKRKGQDEFNY